MVYIRRFHFGFLTFGAFFAYLAFISWKYLREELGGPKVAWNNQEIISTEELRESSKHLWK